LEEILMPVSTAAAHTHTVAGPTYQEMLHPDRLPQTARARAHSALKNELDPANLFNITWQSPMGGIRHVVLPREFTGVDANILVMTGCGFPSGSHKVGAAYVTLMEGELAGEIHHGENTIIGPSTGNFGIGVAYISRLKGYPAIVIMPEQMSKERYERIKKYGGQLDLTPGSESDVILVLERTEFYKKDPQYKVLAQFELLPNYRFHRFVTGQSALEMASRYGNKRVAAFVSSPRATRSRRSSPTQSSALSSRASVPRSSTTDAARTGSKALATRWSP
jgi:cysteine synthase